MVDKKTNSSPVDEDSARASSSGNVDHARATSRADSAEMGSGSIPHCVSTLPGDHLSGSNPVNDHRFTPLVDDLIFDPLIVRDKAGNEENDSGVEDLARLADWARRAVSSIAGRGPKGLDLNPVQHDKVCVPLTELLGRHSKPAQILVMRALMHDEHTFQYWLRNLPADFEVADFRANSSGGRAALEDGDWETAEHCLTRCKEMILRGNLGKSAYASLLTWVNHFLAQLYQSRDKLREVLDLRKEMLLYVASLSDLRLKFIYRSYCVTAQYELADAMGSVEGKNEAIQSYVELLGCFEDEADAQIKFLLCIDHEYLGRFKDSLRWIRESIGVRKNCSDQRMWNHFRSFFLGYEARLLMRLEEFSDAAKALEAILFPGLDKFDYIADDEDRAQWRRRIHEMLEECYKQMSRRAIGDTQQAMVFEDLARAQRDLIQKIKSRRFVRSWAGHFVIPGLPSDHPLTTPSTTHPGGLRLGPVRKSDWWSGVQLHLANLPGYHFTTLFRHCLMLEESSRMMQLWKFSAIYSESMRTLLKTAKKLVDTVSYDWLLSWVDLPLAGVYHFHAKQFQQAIEIYKEVESMRMTSAAELESSSKDHLQIPYIALEYEMSCSNTSAHLTKFDVIQKWATTFRIDKETAERDICFWLYSGYHGHQNYNDAWKWLQKAKKLRQEHNRLVANGGCRRMGSARTDYFCCDCDYNLCEIDLLKNLGKDYEAAITLSLLDSTHAYQDGLVDDAGVDLSRGEPVNWRSGNLRTEPTPTGCVRIDVVGRELNEKVIQSPVGMEHHLLKLPIPTQLAFRKHAFLGRLYDCERADWGNAIFHYELCRQILNTAVLGSELKESYDWLTVWATTPLAILYEFRKKQYKKAVDLLIELTVVYSGIDPSSSNYDLSLHYSLVVYIYLGLYLCAVSDPEVETMVVKDYGRIRQEDDWTTRWTILLQLTKKYTAHGYYEGALGFIRQAKKLILDQRFQRAVPSETMKECFRIQVEEEVDCLQKLQRANEMKSVLDDYWTRTGLSKDDLPLEVLSFYQKIERDQRSYKGTIYVSERDIFKCPSDDPDSEKIGELSLKSAMCEVEKKYAEAISYREQCLQMIEENPKLAKQLNSYYGPGHEHYFGLARLHDHLFMQTLKLGGSTEQITLFLQDENFLRADSYYTKAISMSKPPWSPKTSYTVDPLCSRKQLYLYFAVWDCYTRYLARSRLAANSSQELRAYAQLTQEFLTRISQVPIEKLGKDIIAGYAYVLRTLDTEEHMEGWIELLEVHKFVYTFLQSYYWQKAECLYDILEFAKEPQNLVVKDHVDKMGDSWWHAFMYAEAERARVMLYELESRRRRSLEDSVQHLNFDVVDDSSSALGYIKESCGALLERESSVFVLYSRCATNGDGYFVYVIMRSQDGCFIFPEGVASLRADEDVRKSISSKNQPRVTPESRLDDFYKYLAFKARHPEYKDYKDTLNLCTRKTCKQHGAHKQFLKSSTITDDDTMNKYLEFLYDELIGRIAHRLEKMKPGDKLVLAPSELLTRVPFAALRNPEGVPKEQKYLIQRHAIAMAPSLRVFQTCSDRLQDLQSSRPFTGCLGSIVALGNPEYNKCDECVDAKKRASLPGTQDEVNHIAQIFDDKAVKILTGENATAEQLLEWTAAPSRNSFRQAIVHIGAHGVIDREEHRNSQLQLACGPSQKSASTSTSLDDETSTHWSDRGTPDGEENKDDRSDDDSEEDTNHLAKSVSATGASTSAQHPNDKLRGGPSATSHDLTVEKINKLEITWNAELLVLSACQTSSGRTTAEGVLSLARAFMAVGVPCVVASLWKVDDDATIPFMKDFYEELRHGNDVASAVQSAAIRSMERHGEDAVQCWAPFTVWGAPSLCLPEALQEESGTSSAIRPVPLKGAPFSFPQTFDPTRRRRGLRFSTASDRPATMYGAFLTVDGADLASVLLALPQEFKVVVYSPEDLEICSPEEEEEEQKEE